MCRGVDMSLVEERRNKNFKTQITQKHLKRQNTQQMRIGTGLLKCMNSRLGLLMWKLVASLQLNCSFSFLQAFNFLPQTFDFDGLMLDLLDGAWVFSVGVAEQIRKNIYLYIFEEVIHITLISVGVPSEVHYPTRTNSARKAIRLWQIGSSTIRIYETHLNLLEGLRCSEDLASCKPINLRSVLTCPRKAKTSHLQRQVRPEKIFKNLQQTDDVIYFKSGKRQDHKKGFL